MTNSDPAPQTVDRALWSVIGSIIAFTLGWLVMSRVFGSRLPWQWGPSTGVFVALINIAIEYRRLPERDRLPANAAIVIGAVSVALCIAGAIPLAKLDDGSPPAFVWIAWLLLAIGPAYLFVAGLRARFRSASGRA